MVTWILGRSGAGKTTALRERLAGLAAQYDKIYYLVPEQSSLELERELSKEYPNVKTVSFRRLTNEIFRAFGGVAGSYMTKTRQTALIYRVLAEKKKELVYYRSARPTMGFVSRLSEAFSEFAMSGLAKEQVLPVMEESGRQDWQAKYKDLFLLYEAYCAALDAENRWAAEDLAAATALARDHGFFKETALLIDGFFGFTGRQRELLKVAFSDSPAVFCALLSDPKEQSLLFSSAKGEFYALQKAAEGSEQKTVSLEGGSKRLKYEDLAYLERHLFASRLPKPVEAPHVRLMVGQNLREELAMVAADIAKKVREQGGRWRDYALLAGSLNDYGPVAETVFAKYGIPLFVDRGRASLGKPIFAFVQSALRLISPERYLRQEDLMILLKTGLCGEDRDLISRLENYCILWQINGERLLREADWTQNPAGSGKPNEEQLALLGELNAMKNRLRVPLLQWKETAAAGTGAALTEGLYQLLCDFQVAERIAAMAAEYTAGSTEGMNGWQRQQNRRLGQEYLKLYGVMMDILDDIHSVFGDEKITLSDLEELIGLCGEETALNVAPPTADAVTLGEVAHSRLSEPKELYIVGCNQGILPMPVSDQGLIGDGERRLLVEKELPCNATLQQNALQGQYRFYAALFSATEGLTFSYSAFQMSGEALLPSPYIHKLKAITQCEPILREDMELYDFALTPDGARELMGYEPALAKGILEELGEKPLPPRKKDDRLSQEVVQGLFGRHLRLSYSQISLYQNCPFHYFMEKTMGIRPLEPITFDAANIGTFVHYGMERLMKQLRQEDFDYSSYNAERIQQFGAQFAAEYLEDQLKDFNRSNRFDALYRRMTALFCQVAENVLGELREGRYVPYGEEVPLNGVSLPLSGGKEAELIGSVDRVDTYEVGGATYLKVTDYKTGSRTFEMKGITNKDGVQLPIYLYGLMKSGRWSDPRPGAACYMEARQPVFHRPVLREELPRALADFYKRDGAYNEDPLALQGLDSAGGSQYFKIRYNKDGSIAKGCKVYESALMEELVDHMETVIRDTAEGIFGGNTAILPLKGKTQDACRYCSFAAVCGFDAGKDPRKEYSEEPYGWREEERS